MGAPVWMLQYANLIDEARNTLIKLSVEKEVSCKYAVVLLFSRVTLTMVEIYTLLINGFPEGALALSRSVIEGAVIIEHLCNNKNDIALMERFLDDAKISRTKIDWEINSFIREKQEEMSKTASYEKNIEDFVKRYSSFYDLKKKRFSDYWWVEKNCTFSKLAKKTHLGKKFPYTLASKTLHMSSYNSQNYCSMEESGM